MFPILGEMHGPRLAALADGLHAALDEASATEVSALSDSAVLDAVADLYRAEARTVALKAKLIGELDARNAYAVVGAQSATAWITHRCGVPGGVARRDVLLARSLRHLPATAARLADGDLGAAQAGRIADQHRNPRTRDAAEADDELLSNEAARLPWRLFVTVLAYWVQRVDPDGADAEAQDRKARRRLHLSRTFENCWAIDGLLDPVDGTIVDTALRRIEEELFAIDRTAAAQRLGRDPAVHELDRSHAQRRADALVEMARRASATPSGARRPAPLISILVGYETFAGPICELADRTVLAPTEVAALLDEAVIERAVYDGPSRVMDIGTQRRFTGALRRAIELRDRTCTHPYCDAPIWRCDVDHKIPWENHGPTTDWNGRLYCPFHNHQRQHRRGPPQSNEGRTPSAAPTGRAS